MTDDQSTAGTPEQQPEFVDFGIAEGEDLTIKIISAGEKRLRAEEAEVQKTKPKPEKGDPGGKSMVRVTFSDPDDPAALELQHFFMMPEAGGKENTNKMRKAEWAAFCGAFGLPLQFRLDQVKLTKPLGFVTVTHEKYQGRDSAKISVFQNPLAVGGGK